MIRRRFRNFENHRRNGCPLTELNANEKIITAYYLYLITEKSNNISIGEDIGIYKFLFNLVNYSGKKDKFKKILQDLVEHYEEKGILKPIPKKIGNSIFEDNKFLENCPDEKNCEDDLEIQFPIYHEDNYIQRHFNFDEDDINQINFYRCLMCEESGTFAKIVALTFFMKNPDVAKKSFTIPKRIIDCAADISSIEFLQKELSLSKNECLYILIRYRKATIKNLDEIMMEHSSSAHELYSTLMNISAKELDYILRPDQKLLQYGFFDSDHGMAPELLDCITNQDFNLFFSDLIKSPEISNGYELNTFSVSPDRQKLMQQLLDGNSPVSILLYGKPGSGKTEFAKSLIQSCGKKILIFKNEAEYSKRDNVLSRLNCLLSLKRDDTVLIVDEADTLLRTNSFSFFGHESTSETKGLINKMLEESKNKVIWIVNHVNQMEDSTRRRFTVSCKFESMSPELLQNIAEKKLQTINLDEPVQKKILDLFGTYHITGTSVDNVVKAINSLKNSETDNEGIVRNVELILQENSLLLNGNKKMRDKVSDSYDSSILNCSEPAEKILRMIKNATSFAEKNISMKNNSSSGIRMLFYGLSGTGKTEFARYIAQQLNKKILLKRASDILSKWVGDNEQNIKNAFEEAAANDQILLFDEADTFFSDRNQAHSSWERTMVNEFLTQMEEFPGILICTTNLRNIMDPAMLRQFHITSEFKALNCDGIKQLLEKYFASYKFNQKQIMELCDFNSVTPGDFGRLASKIRFMDSEEISEQLIIDELCSIQKEKMESENYCQKRKIGFSN